MIFFSNRKFFGINVLEFHCSNMVKKTPSFFIPKLPKEDEGILFKGLEINNKYGWKRLMTLLGWQLIILSQCLVRMAMCRWRNVLI